MLGRDHKVFETTLVWIKTDVKPSSPKSICSRQIDEDN